MIELWLSAPPTAPAVPSAEPTDLWGAAIPAWLGALASIAASVVAAIALIREIGTRRGLKQTTAPEPEGPVAQLGPDRGEATTMEPDPGATEGRDPEDDGWGDAGSAIPPRDPRLKPSGIRVVRIDRKQYALLNVLDEPIAILEIREADGGDDVQWGVELPAFLQPHETLHLRVDRSLASPAVIGLDVTYATNDWTSRRRVYLD